MHREPALPPNADPTWAYFLDFDGTLVDIAPTPDAVRVAPALLDLLAALHMRTGGAVAVVSGRPVADLDKYLKPLRLPAAGVHGQEIRAAADGAIEGAGVDTTVLDAVRANAARVVGDFPGVLLEDKGGTVALHYRAAPEARDAAAQAMRDGVAAEPDRLALLEGKMVFEAKPLHVSKGGAVDALMRIAAFAGRRPCFVGDDVTDEDGFKACNARGGVSVKVGAGAESLATYGLADPAAVHAWLAAAVSQGAEMAS